MTVLTVCRLMVPCERQRAYLTSRLERMDRDELYHLIERVFVYLSPVERSALLEVACEITQDWSPCP